MEESIEEMEARLYAQVYHDTSVEAAPETSDYLPLNLNKQSNKRYWQNSKNLSTQKDFNQQPSVNHFTPYKPPPTQEKVIATSKPENQADEKKETAAQAIKAFVPYSSVLSFMATPVPVTETQTPNYEKKKVKAAKFPKTAKVLNPMSKQVTKGKSAMKIEVQAKKQKATMARKKAQNKVIDTIELADTDESDSDCIPVELPPPPLITLDSSDEETIRKKRAMSPSTSSIISDDFIVAGDKRRIANPFKPEAIIVSKKLRKIVEQKETLEKVKALTKAPSSASSSDSARSSSERIVENQIKVPEDKSTKNRSKNSLDNSNEDSIYAAKTAKTKKQSKDEEPKSSSEEETSYVNAKNVTRRKLTENRKKSTEGDHSEVEDPKLKLHTSTPVVKETRRSRFITPSYNEDEFATMISTIVQTVDAEDEQSVDNTEAFKENTNNATVVTIPDSTLSESIGVLSKSIGTEIDCAIVEQSAVVYEVLDGSSDSEDSMRGFNKPIECDLSLNVTQIPYEPHEYIRDRGESSQVTKSSNDTLANPEVGWNDEMKFFYDGSWGDETFCISNILDAMPRDQKFWKIMNSDRNRTFDSTIRVRCKKCNEIGHYAAKCSKPKKRIVCFMCGEDGHRETRCPNSICLRCGKPNRMFTTACSSCNKWSKKYCPLCNYKGHDIEQCPDKWRRYHSTITETTELNSDFQINRRIYCSICAKRGHFAEACNQFFKTISGLITSSNVNIVSHKPSYPHLYLKSFAAQEINRENDELFSLITYFPFFRFNFQFNRNVRLYPKFLEQFQLHMKQKEQSSLQAIEAKMIEKKLKKSNRKRGAKKAPKNLERLQISIDGEGSRSVSTNETLVETLTSTETHDDSNSNYSFTEFYIPSQSQPATNETFKAPGGVKENSFEKAIMKPQEKSQENLPQRLVNPFAKTISNLADFIPLSSDAIAPLRAQIIREPEARCEARMLLTKEHFQMLSSQKGQNFLFDLQSRLNLLAQFKWDSTGNSMLINGLPSDQSIFHVEVREFLYKLEVERYEKTLATSSMLPKSKIRIVSMLKLNLQAVSKVKLYTIKKTLDAMIQAEKAFDHKKALKCRKALNIAFIGDAELEDGGQHIGALRRITYSLEKDLNQGNFEISSGLRDEISEHMKPIFSTMNHGDYCKLFTQYTKVMNKRKKRRMLLNPVIY